MGFISCVLLDLVVSHG